MNMFTQCRLTKVTSTGVLENTTWIPSKFATVGRSLKLKKESGDWDQGWKVHSVFGQVDEKHIPDWRKGIRRHRDSTGDALPKREDS